MGFEIIVIGTSLGGLDALNLLLSGLPKSLPVSVAVVQHRYKSSDNMLSGFLQQHSLLPVVEAQDKEAMAPGRVYLAPADYHLLVEAGSFALSTEAPVCHARPSIDVLFESAADDYAENVIGVILTGASFDGAKGLAKIKARGGLAIVQEPATAISRIMPEAAIAELMSMSPCERAEENKGDVSSGAVNWIMPLEDIAPLLVKLSVANC
jgi:two-component system chemotaxis response regulator CheB